MSKTIYVNWDGHHVKLTWLPSTSLPDLRLVTSVHGVCLDNGKVLLVQVKDRGFNLPGGHMEEGEAPEETLLRECREEGYVKCSSPSFIGMIEVSHEENPLYDENSKYPVVGYQLFYRVNVEECLPFQGDHETTTRIWVEPEQIPYVIDDHELSQRIVMEAIIGHRSLG